MPIILFVVLLVVLFTIEITYFKLAIYFNIIDKPNARSSHSDTTIRGGGIIFFIAALAYFVYSDFTFPFFFLGLICVALVSFADDIFTLSSKLRLIFQLLAIFCILHQLNFSLYYSWIYFLPFMVFGVGIINCYNFMDGINGITGIYSLVVILALWVVNNYYRNFINDDFLYFTLAGLLVFNFFNFREKAVCFAGDVGSISIAVIILFFIAKLSIQDRNPVYFLFLSIYGVDSIITIIQRLYLKENIFKAHRRHLFQILVNERQISHLVVSVIYSFIQLFVSVLIICNLDESFLHLRTLSVLIILTLISVYCLVKFAGHRIQNK